MIQFNKARKWTKGGGRRQRDREVEVHDFKEMRSALPPAHHAYTDGSGFKYNDHLRLVEMTGPSGCGAYLVMQDGQEFFRSRHLGVGTSAMAEVQGMVLAARLFLEKEPEDSLPLFFFTDCRAAIKAATGAVVVRGRSAAAPGIGGEDLSDEEGHLLLGSGTWWATGERDRGLAGAKRRDGSGDRRCDDPCG